MYSNFEGLRKDALDIISKNPGIGSKVLAEILLAGHEGKLNQVQAYLSWMAKRKQMFVRTRVRKGDDIKKLGFYQCWITVPPNMKAEDFIPLHRRTPEQRADDERVEAARTAAVMKAKPEKPKPEKPKPEKPQAVVTSGARALEELVKDYEHEDPKFTHVRVGSPPPSSAWVLDALELCPVTNGVAGKTQADLVLHLKRGTHNKSYTSRFDVGAPAAMVVSDLLSLVHCILTEIGTVV